MTLTATALALSLALGQAAPAAPAPAGPALTLIDAIRRATDANLDLKVARARLDQARAQVGQAWAGYLPQVSAGATWTHNSDAAAITLPTGYYVRDLGSPQGPPAGGTVDGAPTNLALVPSGAVTADIQKQDQVGAQVQASQALLAPPLWFSIRGAGQAAASAEQGVEGARRGIQFGVAQLYYGVTSLKKLVEVSERLLEIAQRQEKDAEVRFKAGTIAKVGYLRAEIERARAEQDLKRARASYESAKIGLAVALDRDTAFEVVEPPEPPAAGEPAALEEAARKRPEVRSARLAADAAGSFRDATTMTYLPTLGAFGRWQVANLGGFTGNSDSWAVGLGLNWTLLDGGLREARLREGNARVAEAEAARRNAEVKAVAEVRQALLDLESARANAAKAREQRDLAAENQRLVDVSYRAGAATAVEQADASTQLRNAEIAVATETLQAQLAALRVLQAAGEFEPLK